MKKIEGIPHTYTTLLNGDQTKEPVITKIELQNWFNENLKGKYIVDPSEMVRVEGTGEGLWSDPFRYRLKDQTSVTHRAYLVGIEPIKKETAFDLLKELMELPENMAARSDWKARAKAVLARGDDD